MIKIGTATASAILFGLSFAYPTTGAVAQPQSASDKQDAPKQDAANKDAAKQNAAVTPEAVEALKRMSDYLGTLTSFEVKADTTLDLVLNSGQRVQVGGVSQYKVRRPNGFQIDLVTDFMKRRFYFDGAHFTIFAPDLKFYATADAPPTIAQVLDVVYDKFGISLPLEDLFRWNDPKNDRDDKLTSAFLVGRGTVDGADTDHYAFREGTHDWEIWIQRGDKPLPRKLVIVDRSDSARPAYVARLSWTENATLAATDFTFVPGSDVKLIHQAALDQ